MRTLVSVGIFAALALHVAAAAAAEPLQFPLPAGWVADAAEAKSRDAAIYATDTRTQPAADMTGMRMPVPVFADDGFVRGFVNGIKKSIPSFVEVKHDFIDVGGLRAVRIIADVASDGEQYRQVYYAMPLGHDAACLVFTIARSGFDARLASFDAIARTTKGLVAATAAAK